MLYKEAGKSVAQLDEIRNMILEIGKNPGTAAKRSEEALKLQRAKLQKHMLEKDLDEQYAKIGRLYLAALGDGEIPENMVHIVNRIRACKEAIDETQQRISGSE